MPSSIATIAPVDEAAKDPLLQQARDLLITALQQDDMDTLSSLVSPVADAGSPTTTLASRLSREAEAATRAGLLDALRHGGAFTTERGQVFGRPEFCAPYAYARYPSIKDRAEWFMESPGVLLSANVPVHKEPASHSPVLTVLTHTVVQSFGTIDDRDRSGRVWVEIGLPDGTGYVPDSEIWRPDEYHVCLAKTGSSWLVSTIGTHVFSAR